MYTYRERKGKREVEMSDHVVAVLSAPPISRLSDLMMFFFRIFGARLFGDFASNHALHVSIYCSMPLVIRLQGVRTCTRRHSITKKNMSM